MIKTEDRETMKAIDEILQKVRANEVKDKKNRAGKNQQFKKIKKKASKYERKLQIQAKDLKTSEMLLTYERKIALMQDRERELEMLVKAKDQALQHNERLRQQYKNGFGRTEQNEEEVRVKREKRSLCNDILRIFF